MNAAETKQTRCLDCNVAKHNVAWPIYSSGCKGCMQRARETLKVEVAEGETPVIKLRRDDRG